MAEEPQTPVLFAPSAFRVSNGSNKGLDGQLYFFVPKEFTGVPPIDQVKVFDEFEQFCQTIRIVLLPDRKADFDAYFARILVAAQGTFSSQGFNPIAASDLKMCRAELLHKAGASIKAAYISKILTSVAFWSLIVLATCGVLEASARLVPTENATTKGSGDGTKTKATAESSQDSSRFSIINTGVLVAASFYGLLFAAMSRSYMPTFETLKSSEADLMEPWFRLLFYGIAVVIIALIFETEFVTVSFGNNVSTVQISKDWVVAAMIGLLLGVAERALPGEVQTWSTKILPSSATSPT